MSATFAPRRKVSDPPVPLTPAPSPEPKPARHPGCRYCNRYDRACGRAHDAATAGDWARSWAGEPGSPADEPAWRRDPATPNQLGKIAQLRPERDPEGKLGANPPNMTKGQASDAITWLLRQRPVARPVVPSTPPPATPPPNLHYGDGLHFYAPTSPTDPDAPGYFIRVRHNVSTGNRYVLAFTPDGEWIKRRGGTRALDRDLFTRAGVLRAVTADEASQFGKTYGVCINCGRALSDDRSISAGYGKTCAENQGWPWG